MTLRRRAKGYQMQGGVAILVWRGAWVWFWSIPNHAIEHDQERAEVEVGVR